ncbi:MAG: hypothetical protein AVDCRST_MAG76-2185 [uncultured Acidimicrobiales bacterium]|uniref:DUF192 domain-containing protein n=1 Tax=uncultured Acidimicrobiales bacterium TaxID=310071 RepID=A0A6J4IF26_9ACTN|nr:MAG: hypothetical protein AVDCRST_MAG76-2185 [uncultured Acidimicrobiales bacterium]
MAPSLLELPPQIASSALGRPGARRWLGRVVWVLALVAVASLFSVGGSQPDDPYLFGRQPVQGFGQGTLKVLTVASGSSLSPAEHCSLLAKTAAQQARGLMNRRDLAGYASMVFDYSREVDVLFYNRNVPMALTVAWFDGDGRWVGSRDLEPCPDIEGCPTVAAPANFRYAVEVEVGGLSRLGLGPGSQIALAEGC